MKNNITPRKANVTDRLLESIAKKECPVCVGLDTMHTYIPGFTPDAEKPASGAAKQIIEFNKEIIDAVADVVPAIKIQSAYYEMYSCHGVKAFYKTIQYAKEKGLFVIADVKRNDIDSTAAAYSAAYLGGLEIGDERTNDAGIDYITVNPYLGSDGILPFVRDCAANDKGIFVLCKTSNKSSGEFQDLVIDDRPLYSRVMDRIDDWGCELRGSYGYSAVGAVVGATYKEQAQALRSSHPGVFFLIPGYGAQGATADDIAVNFDKNGFGGIVNSSRGILLAYKKEKYAGMGAGEAARAAVLDMKNDILGAFGRCKIGY